MKKLSVLFLLILFLSSNLILNADDKKDKKEIHKFKMIYNIENTSVKIKATAEHAGRFPRHLFWNLN